MVGSLFRPRVVPCLTIPFSRSKKFEKDSFFLLAREFFSPPSPPLSPDRRTLGESAVTSASFSQRRICGRRWWGVPFFFSDLKLLLGREFFSSPVASSVPRPPDSRKSAVTSASFSQSRFKELRRICWRRWWGVLSACFKAAGVLFSSQIWCTWNAWINRCSSIPVASEFWIISISLVEAGFFIRWLANGMVMCWRGKIPLNAESVYRTMGLPRGDVPVTYAVDSAIEKRLAPVLFPGLPSTPETTELFTILKDMKEADESFKQVWIMYLVSTVVAPTSRNRVSNSCYPIMDKVDDVKNMTICQFVCDRLHEELSVGELSAACLLQIMLMYVDSLDISALNIELPEGPFVVNVWSKELIGTVLDADMKRDLSGFGNLELKPHLAIDHMFFGGPEDFQSWIDTNTSLDCPKPRKEKVTRLVGDFVSGMTRLLSTLVQGWTEVDECDALVVEKSLGNLSDQFGLDGAPYADIPCHTPPAFVPTTDIIADKPSSSVPIDSNTFPSSNMVMTRSASKKTACAGIAEETPTVNRNVSFQDPIADIVSPRLTRSASSKIRVSYTPDDVGDSGGSQDGKSAPSDNDSDYAEEEDADRFIIESRVAEAGKTIPGGDCSSAKHSVDLSLNFSMPTQSFNVHSSYEPVESYTNVETAASKFTADGKSICIMGNLGGTESSQGIVDASVKEPEIANLVIIAGKDHTDDGEGDCLDVMTDGTNVSQKEPGLVSNASFLVDACKVTVTASDDGLADLSYSKKEHYTRQKKRKVDDKLKEDNASILFKKQKASAAKLILAGKRQTHQGTRSSPHFLSKQRVGGLADETTYLKGIVSDTSTSITTSVGADCSKRDGSKDADVSIVNEDNTSTLFNALPSAPHGNGLLLFSSMC